MMGLPARATRDSWRPATTLGVVFVHLVALLAPFYYSWQGLAAFLLFYYLTGCWGVTFGYHRLFSHRSFKAHPLVKYFAALMGCLTLQSGPLWWSAHHRLHHRESDKPMDPHSPKDGFLWSHMLWFNYTHPSLASNEAIYKAVPDLSQDAVLRWMDKHFEAISIAKAALLWGLSALIWDLSVAWSVLLWGCFLRTVVLWHGTWLINSATHCWGYKSYDSGDDSLNNPWVTVFTFGEGWHNNHHARQRPARSGHRWYELDPTYWHIALLNALGLVWDVVPLTAKSAKPVLTPVSGTSAAGVKRQAAQVTPPTQKQTIKR